MNTATFNEKEITEDMLFSSTLHRKPNNILVEYTYKMQKNIPVELLYYKELLEKQGWTFYVVDNNRGYCKHKDKVITIPLFAFHRGNDYLTWYIAHEIAHAFNLPREQHGQSFMNTLKKVCPVYAIHYELQYKPRNALNAGISLLNANLDW